MPNVACNYTILQQDCTLQTCCLNQGTVNYIPTLAGNITYAAIFVPLLALQLGLCLWYRTWTFMVGMVCGLLCEIIGYAGRIWTHYSIFDMNPFLMYLICLTIGPAFLSASIYLCLSRIVHIYSASTSRIRPKYYTYVFISCDLVSLILQGAGGGIAATAASGDHSQINLGTNIMIGGLSFQVFSLLLFMILCVDFALRIRKVPEPQRNEEYQALRRTRLFKGFLLGIGIATIFIFIRCCYRVAELESGFGGALANNEPVFMVLEGPMIVIAVTALTVFHPGLCLGGLWASIGSSIGGGEKNFAIWSGSPLRGLWASIGSSIGGSKKNFAIWLGSPLRKLWASIGSPIGGGKKNFAIWSGSPLRGLWVTVHRFAGKTSNKGAEHKPEKAMSTPSARNSEEDVSS